jgi:hypothetical protein
MLEAIKNFFKRDKTPKEVVSDDYVVNKDNAFIIYEYGPEGLYIHQNKPPEISAIKFAELMFSVNSGSLRGETMECLMESFEKAEAERIIDAWGDYEIQNQVAKMRSDNSKPIVSPRDFFRSANQ